MVVAQVDLHVASVSASWLAWAPWVSGVLLLAVGVILGLRRRRRRALRAPPPPPASGFFPRLAPGDGGPAKGLEEVARAVEARLDEKIDRLEHLVREADRVLEALGLYVDALNGAGAAAKPASGEREPVRERTQAEPHPRDTLSAVTPEARERVLALARAGKRPESISEALGLRRGEVDLILGLERIAERAKAALRDGPRRP